MAQLVRAPRSHRGGQWFESTNDHLGKFYFNIFRCSPDFMKKQVIELKPSDIKKAVVRSLKHGAWETSKTGRSTKELVHVSSKHKPERHKKKLVDLENEF